MILSWTNRIYSNSVSRSNPRSLIMSKLKKRVSFFSPSPYLKAGITLESCMVLPLFLFFMTTLLYLFEIIRFQSDVYEAMHQAGSRAGVEAFQNRNEDSVFSEETIQSEIKRYLDQQLLPYLCVKDETDGVFIQVGEDEGKNLMIHTEFKVRPFLFLLPIGNLEIQEHIYTHGFTGYTPENPWEENVREPYVYITRTGGKYHFQKECTYLRVKVRGILAEQIADLRNGSGEKYYPCELCGYGGNSIVYIAEWGNRYHMNSNCSSLRRTVYIVPLSEVGGRTACSKCS